MNTCAIILVLIIVFIGYVLVKEDVNDYVDRKMEDGDLAKEDPGHQTRTTTTEKTTTTTMDKSSMKSSILDQMEKATRMADWVITLITLVITILLAVIGFCYRLFMHVRRLRQEGNGYGQAWLDAVMAMGIMLRRRQERQVGEAV